MYFMKIQATKEARVSQVTKLIIGPDGQTTLDTDHRLMNHNYYK